MLAPPIRKQNCEGRVRQDGLVVLITGRSFIIFLLRDLCDLSLGSHPEHRQSFITVLWYHVVCLHKYEYCQAQFQLASLIKLELSLALISVITTPTPTHPRRK